MSPPDHGHLALIDDLERIEAEMRHGAFDGYRHDGGDWGDV